MTAALWLIYPPQADPSLVPPLFELSAMMAQRGLQVRTLDLNLEAYTQLCTRASIAGNARRLKTVMAALEEKPSLAPPDQARYVRTALALLRSEYLAEQVPVATASLRGEYGVPDHAGFQSAARVVTRTIEMASALYFPTVLVPIDLHMRFSSESSAQVAKAAYSQENPFRGFLNEWAARIVAEKPGHVHLIVDRDQQLIPAVTLASALRERGLRTVTCGGTFVTRFHRALSVSPALADLFQASIPGPPEQQAEILTPCKNTPRQADIPGDALNRYWCPRKTWQLVLESREAPTAPVDLSLRTGRQLGASQVHVQPASCEQLTALAPMAAGHGLAWGAEFSLSQSDLYHLDPRSLAKSGCSYLHFHISGHGAEPDEAGWTSLWGRCREAGIAVLLTLTVGHPEVDATSRDAPLRLALRPEVSRTIRLQPFRIAPDSRYAATPDQWHLSLIEPDPALDLLRFVRHAVPAGEPDPIVATATRWASVVKAHDINALPDHFLAGYVPALFGMGSPYCLPRQEPDMPLAGAPPAGLRLASSCQPRPFRFALEPLLEAGQNRVAWEIPQEGPAVAPAPKPAWYLYAGSNDQILPLSEGALRVLHLCDGSCTAEEIASGFGTKMAGAMQVVDRLRAGGIIIG